MKALVGQGLTKRFDSFIAVNNVSLEVEEGGIHAVIGPNGAGKTTLFNLLTGQLSPDAGRVFYFDRDITRLPVHERARLGLVRTFQVTKIFRTLTVLENVRAAILSREGEVFNFWKHARNIWREEAMALLDDTGLANVSDATAGTLSHGDQKRLELALGLACRPRILLLDEPTAGLAPRDKFHFIELIGRITQQRRLTVLLIEHDMGVVFSISKRISVMHLGRIVAEGTPDEIKGNERVQEIYFGKGEWLWKSLGSTSSTD
jgi:branched-chain amino acid transport system ATP-binding protein